MGGRMADKVVTPHGAIGQQIFAQVEQLTAGGAMKRLAAFKQIAAASGRAEGTVAANYYRVARQNGAPLRRRRPGRPPGSGAGTSVSRGAAALQVIAAALRAQEQELTRLRSELGAFEKVRRLLKG
jgi:hypothetical protein